MIKALLKKILSEQTIEFGLNVTTFFAIKIYSVKYRPLIIRKASTDFEVFKSIFVKRELKLPIKIKPKLIIDAGAYTGFSTLYYHSKYPLAKIIAIEPETSNFDLLEKHTKQFPNIIRIKAGLWNKNAFLKISDIGAGEWGFIVKEVAGNEPFDVKAITMDEILEKSGFDKIDILKLDIEGAEKQLFSENYASWLDKVNVLEIELHNRINKGCSEAVYAAINKNEWNEYKKSEKAVFVRKIRN